MSKKINWRVRLRNKVWLASFISVVVRLIYTILGLLDIFPAVTKNTVMQIVNEGLMFLSLVGVLIDPTTEGIYDSNRAMGYVEPWNDEIDGDGDVEIEDDVCG